MKIHILPPFYLSGWAYFIYLLLGILSVVGIIYYFQKRNEQKHQQAMEKFEREKERELYTAKIDFFTNVAHEIRTPLTLIKSPLENVLVSPNVSADIRDDLEIMNLNTTRLLDLVNQLLDFRKTETRGFQLNFVECNISDILQQIYMRFTPLARQKKLEFVIECSESIYASIDREALTKIISNLFTNAIKYSETYIHVRLWMEDTCWFLSVCNDGNVIPMEMREEIFKPFIQYKDGFSRKVSGTGIGLALARSLAELHEGNLIMDDSQKQNCFILSLPVKHEHTIAISTGNQEGAPKANAASLRNRGFELSLGWKDQVSDFKYGALLNITTLSNKVLSLGYEKPFIDSGQARTRLNGPLAEFFNHFL